MKCHFVYFKSAMRIDNQKKIIIFNGKTVWKNIAIDLILSSVNTNFASYKFHCQGRTFISTACAICFYIFYNYSDINKRMHYYKLSGKWVEKK